jgi:hypothetical protein
MCRGKEPGGERGGERRSRRPALERAHEEERGEPAREREEGIHPRDRPVDRQQARRRRGDRGCGGGHLSAEPPSEL